MFKAFHDSSMTNLRALRFKILIFAAWALCGCQSLFYFPSQEKFYSPERIQLKYEDVRFKTASGNEIHGWYFATSQKHSKGTILFFHGNAQNLTSHFMMFYWLPKEGYNYLIFDYPGYGESLGKPNPANTVEAGIAAAGWIKENKDPRPLIIYGQSLGGIIAMQTAMKIKDQQPISRIVIDASFSSYRKMARRVLARSYWTWWMQPITYLVLNDSQSPEPIDRLAPIPMLFIHGADDPVIESESSQDMFAKAHDPKQLWIVPNGHHGDLFEVNNRELRQNFLNYLQQ
ncbi:alpha/beta hydrolase [Bdellovibrio sp. SKB1291214]|uniref:alpha/beta hydrolase n=1 Tax=Bdellovibrio sp. SKB1291214 TaxID=1732569 RepID=UPI00223FC28D|nr:alpha/beta hydrolase [Bdellovibrio sp. SKB1291214]UYL09770.1 alpha/beta hydrolase [Bdellovibrio sp. SKB1291214]